MYNGTQGANYLAPRVQLDTFLWVYKNRKNYYIKMNSKIKNTTYNYYYPLLWKKRSTIQITTLQFTYPTVPVSCTGKVKCSSSSLDPRELKGREGGAVPFPTASLKETEQEGVFYSNLVFIRHATSYRTCYRTPRHL